MTQENNNNSILGKVLNAQKALSYDPVAVIDELIENILEQREREVIRQRHGLGFEPKTLDAIGKQFGITRERVRQIAKQATHKLSQSKADNEMLHALDLTLKHILERSGGVREEVSLLNDFFADRYSDIQERTLLFFVEHISDLIERAPFKKNGWQLIGAPIELQNEMENMVHNHLYQLDEPLTIDTLHEALLSSDEYTQWKNAFIQTWPTTQEVQKHDWKLIIRSYLELSHKLGENPFGEWGVITSPLIKPRRMADKIYLVLRKYKKPLHFKRITELINEHQFDKRTAYQPTVHNELILDDRFVLVGRGIYALKEWGYTEGTVVDVLISVLKQAPEPLTREQIIEQVLKERMVKEGTVLLALTDRDMFARTPDGRYTITEQG